VIGAGEIVQLKRLEGTAPAEFFWRGERHVVRSWEARRQRPSGRATRALYRVRTASGLRCEISEDAGRGLWRMERVLRSRGGRP
jgi:hypothetical protein